MRCFNLTINLPQARNSWRVISTKLRSNLRRLKSSKAFHKITGNRFVPAPSYNHFLHRNRNQPQKSFMTIFVDELYEVHQEEKNKVKDEGKEETHRAENKERIRVRGEPSSSSSSHYSVKPSDAYKVAKGVDENCAKRKGKVVEMRKYRSVDEAWNAVVASSPHFRGVDERAEEFISKFKHDMKLQKERSLLEFEEMLARCA